MKRFFYCVALLASSYTLLTCLHSAIVYLKIGTTRYLILRLPILLCFCRYLCVVNTEGWELMFYLATYVPRLEHVAEFVIYFDIVLCVNRLKSNPLTSRVS